MTPLVTLREGDAAPAFSGRTADGGTISLADYAGRPLLLYFYPRDDTPGCTRQACELRDCSPEFQRRGLSVLGISADSEKSHGKFIRKHQLPFPLISDPNREIIVRYGVWGEKMFMGRRFQGIHRVSFLIDATGRIQKLWTKVKPSEHAAEVLAALGH